MSVSRRGACVGTLLCLLFGALPSSAAASHKRVYHPRAGNALGMVPPVNAWGTSHPRPYDSTAGTIYLPVIYHGGQTMTGGVTVHTIFWAPAGYAFQGAPPHSQSYEGLIEQYFSDVAAASTGNSGAPCTSSSCNVFTVVPQYGWGTEPAGVTAGDNAVTYDPTTDAVVDTHSYPAGGCSSPGDTRACVTDAQVQAEVDRIVQATPGRPRGLHNIWFVFLPPNVDECVSHGMCGTTAFAAYHALSNVHRHGETIYALAIDPIIEIGGFPTGEDPEGNPDAEFAVDIAAHEVNEAMTDPAGGGWYDAAGFEVGDRCDTAPQRGTPLGYAPDGSPYNQVIHGHQYLIQEMWSNADQSCAQASDGTANGLPVPQVDLTQFSSIVHGNTEDNTAGIHVTVSLIRSAGGTPVTVARGSSTTASNGSWSVRLSGGHAVGDDRDEIEVDYSGPRAPRNEVILTGNGGDPYIFFGGGGWTGWTALDEGSALTNHDPAFGGRPSLSLAPCGGVLAYAGVSGAEPPGDFCGTASSVADIQLNAPVTPSAHVTASSTDNRAFGPPNLSGGGNLGGALVRLTVSVGEPDAAPNFAGSFAGFTPTGFPVCDADLGTRRVGCAGLVSGESYTLRDGSTLVHARADQFGIVAGSMPVREGDQVTLANSARVLTTLHVARLQVHILGSSPTVSSGKCSPGDYWRGPLTKPPTNQLAGEPTRLGGGSALTGVICPASGGAAGLPAGQIAQTDDRSGGATFTQVAELVDISPIEGETLYGKFLAVAEASDGSSPVSLAIFKAAGHKRVFSARNVDKNRGVPVRALRTGNYIAIWTVRDGNGDTREYISRFVEEQGSSVSRHQHG